MKKLVFLFFLLFIGCAPSLTVINQKYSHSDFKLKTMILCPLMSNSLRIENADDVVDDFGKTDKRKPDEIIRDSCFFVMQKEMINNAKLIKPLKIDDPQPLISLSQDKYFFVTRKVGKDSLPLSFGVPQRISIAANPDVILILNQIGFSRFNGSAGSSTPGMGGGSFPSLNSTLNYLLWSYADSEAISYGQISVETPFLFGMTHSTWISHFSNILHSVFSNTPFSFIKAQESE
jgi:hypothetical protein